MSHVPGVDSCRPGSIVVMSQQRYRPGSIARRRAGRSERSPVRLGSVLVLAAAFTCLVGCTASEPVASAPQTIVLITVGGLRADWPLELEGERGQVLQSLASSSAVFERAYAPSTLDVQSLAALFSGRLPTRGGSIGVLEAQPAQQAVTLATRLRRAGYGSSFVAHAEWAARPGFTRGFDAVEVAQEGEWAAHEITRRALRALDGMKAQEPDAPAFLAVHYAGPAGTASPEGGDVRAAYGTAMTETLEGVSDLLAGLRERVAERILIVLTATDGYELGERGGVGSGWTVYDEVARVPLLVSYPDVIEAGPVTATVSTIDLVPSLLQLAGAEPVQEGEIDGRELFTFEGQSRVPSPEPGPRLVELVVRERAMARAVVEDSWKYVHVLKAVPPVDRAAVAEGIEELQAAMLSGAIETPPLFGEAIAEELYDLARDPEERVSRLVEKPAALARLRSALRAYRSACDRTAFSPQEMTRRLEIDPAKVRQLESLGYL